MKYMLIMRSTDEALEASKAMAAAPTGCRPPSPSVTP